MVLTTLRVTGVMPSRSSTMYDACTICIAINSWAQEAHRQQPLSSGQLPASLNDRSIMGDAHLVVEVVKEAADPEQLQQTLQKVTEASIAHLGSRV